jgi:type IV pilus assembly protein PilA
VYTSTGGSTGVITVVAAGEAKITGKQIIMTGALQTNGQVVWTCSAPTTDGIDSKYLPASCK